MGDEPTPLGVLCKGGCLHERALAERVLDASIREGFLTAAWWRRMEAGGDLGRTSRSPFPTWPGSINTSSDDLTNLFLPEVIPCT
jgi:hypothetical protein